MLATQVLLVLLPVLYVVLPYLVDSKRLRRFPAPFPAQFTDFWLFLQARRGHRYLSVHEAHQKYGTMVRIQPNHISIADPEALGTVYGHGNGFLKSEYYDAFVSLQRGLFNTRSRPEHTRKRKTVSHVFSNRSVLQFEQYMVSNLVTLRQQWNALCERPEKDGYVTINALHWFNYLAFDIIADLTFGSPFGMLAAGKDEAMVKDPYTGTITKAPAIEVLNRRGEVSGTLGCAPWLKPYAKWLPDSFFRNGVKAVENLAGIAVAKVSERLDEGKGAEREDLLRRLQEGRDEKGEKMGRKELEAEALTMLIAGSDTTSNTLCALLYWMLKTPGVQEKLQKEIDENVPGKPGDIPPFSTVRDLPYLNGCIQEILRIHSTSSLGLHRTVPEGGCTIKGEYFAPGTTLSVPSYTLHHSKEIWGPDADQFVPERWMDGRPTELQKQSFIPFSVGPRACIGRNVAEMEMTVIVATVFKGWEFVVRPGALEEWKTREGFLRKPLGLMVGMKKRT